MTDPIGYSGTPLAQKLGLKDGQRVTFIGLPDSLDDLRTARTFADVADAPWGRFGANRDIIHAFTTVRADLERHGKALMAAIVPDGTIWISWPKKAARIPTDITEDVIREVLLPIGLVDVKVCAVDATWSGLKMVIRKELRPKVSREGRK
jgi:hypothetical protein